METENNENQKPKEQETANEQSLPSCCKPQGKKGKGLAQGIAFGLIPHAGCIAFILASVLGLTVAASFFRPLLAKSYFFYIMIAMSMVFATISALFYLRINGGINTARNHKGYLTILYGSTILISVLLYFVVFPIVASASAASITGTGQAINTNTGANLENMNTLTLKVAIPCPGHAPLITGDLKGLEGVVKVEYAPTSTFKVYYDPAKTTKQQILGLPIFQEYKATVIDESSGVSTTASNTTATTTTYAGGNVQIVKLSVVNGRYVLEPSTVKKGIPVRLEADLSKMPGCSKSVVISTFNVNKYLTPEDNIIEFTPNKAGIFNIACSMNMYKGTFEVLESDETRSNYVQPSSNSGGGCGCGGGSGGSCGG